jgi:hypothetical protein
MKHRAFMARFGKPKHIVDLLKAGQEEDGGGVMVHELTGAMQNPHFNGGHITMLLNSIEGDGSHVNPVRREIARHPLTSKKNLERLVEPHRGWPFQGTQPHMWPDHAKIANQRLKFMDEDE